MPAEELQKRIEKPNLQYKPLSNGWSVYRTEKGLMRIRVDARRFDRSAYRDLDGQPQYVVVTEIVLEGPRKAETTPQNKAAPA